MPERLSADDPRWVSARLQLEWQDFRKPPRLKTPICRRRRNVYTRRLREAELRREGARAGPAGTLSSTPAGAPPTARALPKRRSQNGAPKTARACARPPPPTPNTTLSYPALTPHAHAPLLHVTIYGGIDRRHSGGWWGKVGTCTCTCCTCTCTCNQRMLCCHLSLAELAVAAALA